ncbi:hypothetical protein KQI65_03415 [bacterium]|nr:hypothetical protein [bacterium]
MMVLRSLAALLLAGVVSSLLLSGGGRPDSGRSPAEYDRPDAAAKYFYEQRAWPNGIPPRAYESAAAHVRSMDAQGLRKSAPQWRWLNLGPVNIAGRIRSMAIDPKDPTVIYAGSAGGGVWKSTNSGFDWRALGDLLPNLRIGAIAVDPFDSDRILAGCGEGYVAWQGAAAFGQGIYLSSDGGESWELLPSTLGRDFWYVYDVDFDPYQPDVVLACTWQGVYRSSDGGQSWRNILSSQVSVFSAMVAFSETQAGVVYAGLEAMGIYRSTDHGEHFTSLGQVLDTQYSRVVIAPAPSDGDIIYAAFTDHVGKTCAGLMKSSNGGMSWEELPIPYSRVSGVNYMGEQGRFNSTLTVHPADPNTVWAGGIDLHRSTDGGFSWQQMTNWYPYRDYSYVHADQHVLLFNPANPGEMLAASDGGMFRSLDGGENFAEMTSGMVTVQFHSGAPHPHSDMVLGGTIDNGNLRVLDGDLWTDVTGGDGGYTAIDPDEPRYMYAELYYLHFMKSTDFGRTFYRAMNGIPRAQDFGSSDPVGFIAPFEMSPLSPKTLYAGTNRVYRTTNGAELWERISDDLAGNNAFITAIGLAASDPDVIYVGSSRGRVSVTTNGGDSWTRIDQGLFSFFITDFAVHPADPRDVIVTLSGFGSPHAWRSTDAGGSWTSIAGEGATALPDIPANTVFRHPELDREIYVGTDVGLFVSTDKGLTWAVDNEGIGNVIIADLRMRADGVLFAATHGRGMYRSSRSIFSDAPVPVTVAWLGQNYPNPVTSATGAETIIPYSLAGEGDVAIRISDMAGRRIRERRFRFQSSGDYRFPLDMRGISSGAYSVQLFFNGALSGERRLLRVR